MMRIGGAAQAAILAAGVMAAACIGFGLARVVPVGEAQFEVQVEEGLGTFDRLPVRWVSLRRR
ncbi:MAG: hypothetical protein KGL11_02345 [Alphaproteobacteria bacterium]|nr:hypothetical protein [Alphaproteobacteria bacterium]